MNRSYLILSIFGIIILAFAAYTAYKRYGQHVTRTDQIEHTLAIIKPDAVLAHLTGKIIDRLEQAGFTILDLRKITIESEQAEKLYADYRNEKFFHQLVDHMISGPIVVMVLEKMNAIPDLRELIGETDPARAKEGTLRKQFGVNIWHNAIQGSKDAKAAAHEIKLFFADRGVH